MFDKTVSAVILAVQAIAPTASPTPSVQFNVQALLASSNSLSQIEALPQSQKQEVRDYLLKYGLPKDVKPSLIADQLTGLNSPQYATIPLAEMAGCVTQVSMAECITGSNDATTASNTATSLYPRSRLDSYQDAMRHCYWNSLMSIHMSTMVALKIASNHEAFNPGTAAQTAMDLYNNDWGRYTKSLTNSTSTGQNYCKTWTDNGTLVRLQ